MGRNIVLSLFLLSLFGCATTQNTSMAQLQSRVDELERKLKQKDDEIGTLKSDLDQVTYKAKKSVDTYSSSSEHSSSSSSSGNKKNIIRVDASTQDVQEALKKAGYYNGNVDGKIGNKTKSAISQFQRDHSLKADGIIGRKTWEELQAAGAPKAATTAAAGSSAPTEVTPEESSSEHPVAND